MSDNPKKSVTLRITNAKTGDYTARVYVGSEKKPYDVILDTGSSAFAIRDAVYDPEEDAHAKATRLFQHGQYGTGSWSGVLIQTSITVGEGNKSLQLNDVHLAATHHSQNMFDNCDGILGLAYRPLDEGLYKLSDDGKKLEPVKKALMPYFTQLEELGVVADKFSFYTLRSCPSLALTDPELDPVNKGWLILGGGEEHKEFYEGEFKTIKVTHDVYYNVNLKSIYVGHQPPIPIPPAKDPTGMNPNCIIDSGTNGVIFPDCAYQGIFEQFVKINPKLGEIITDAFKNRLGYPQSQLDLTQWPDINLVFEGDNGDTTLSMKPDTYWQTDAGGGMASLRFLGSAPNSIMGLPLMNNYYCVFDRSADNKVGVIKFADIKKY